MKARMIIAHFREYNGIIKNELGHFLTSYSMF